MKTINQANRAEWLEARRAGIGASEMPILLGESEWGSNVTLWAQKCGLETDEQQDTELMELGRELEQAIITITAKRAGVTISNRGQLIRSPTIEWAIATPDAITVNGEPIEVKNLSFGFSDEEWQESIPEKYRIQCNHQMLCTHATRCLFGVLVWGNRVVWEWVPRDETLIRRIKRAGDAFWKHVVDRVEPAADGNKHARNMLAARATVEGEIELSADAVDEELTRWSASDNRLAELRKQARSAEKERDSAANRIAQMMGNNRSAFTADGWRFEWKRSERKGHTVKPKTIDKFTINEPKRQQ